MPSETGNAIMACDTKDISKAAVYCPNAAGVLIGNRLIGTGDTARAPGSMLKQIYFETSVYLTIPR